MNPDESHDSIIDRICDEFESAFGNSEHRPSIHDFVPQGSDEQLVSRLLQNLILLEVELRMDAGDDVAAEEYEEFGARHVAMVRKKLFNDPSELTVDPVSTPSTIKPEIKTGQFVGPYELVRLIGIGGMGEVWEARQESPLRRTVALKLIKPTGSAEQALVRFETERNALAAMDHPNIARVFDAGTATIGEAAPQPYFVMEFVDNAQTITEYCDSKRMPLNERLQLFRTVCQAVHHAHQRLVIHRDLKPSNILVTEYDGQPVVKVIDFGLAKALHAEEADQRENQLTELSQEMPFDDAFTTIVGTPTYMSPEQATEGETIGTRTDVFSLGAILYELLTGCTPIDRDSVRRAVIAEVLEMIRNHRTSKPSERLSSADKEVRAACRNRDHTPETLRDCIVGELDWVVMKSLSKSPEARYASAIELGDEIERFLNKDPLKHYPPEWSGYETRKFAEKHSRIIGAVVLAILVLIGISSYLEWSRRIVRDQSEQLAKVNEDLADERKSLEEQILANEQMLRKASANQYAIGKSLWLDYMQDRRSELKWKHSIAYLTDALRYWPKNPLAARTLYNAFVDRYQNGPREPMATVQGYFLAISPDGEMVLSVTSDSTLQLYSFVNDKVVAESPPQPKVISRLAKIRDIIFDGNVVEILFDSGQAAAWNHRTGTLDVKETHAAWTVIYEYDETTKSSINYLHLPNGEIIEFWSDPELYFDANNSHVLVKGNREGQGYNWSYFSDDLGKMTDVTSGSYDCVISPDGNHVVAFQNSTVLRDDTLRLWITRDSKFKKEPLASTPGAIQGAAFLPDSSAVWAWGQWGVSLTTISGQTLASFELDEVTTDARVGATISPDGTQALVWHDQKCELFDATHARTIKSHTSVAVFQGSSGAFSQDGLMLAINREDTSVEIVNTITKQRVGLPFGRNGHLKRIIYSKDSKKILLAGSSDTTVWRTSPNGVNGWALGETDARVMAISPNGRRVIRHLGHWAGPSTLEVVNANGGDLIGTIESDRPINRVQFCNDSERFVANGRETNLVVSSKDANIVDEFEGNFVAIGPEGRKVILQTYEDGRLTLRDVETKTEADLEGIHYSEITGISFFADGQQVCVLSQDGSIIVFDAATGLTNWTRKVEMTLLGEPKADGDLIAFQATEKLSNGTFIIVANQSSGELIKLDGDLFGYGGGINFLKNGRELIAVSGSKLIAWSTFDGKVLREKDLHEGLKYVLSDIMSPNGRLADYDGVLWDMETFEPLGHCDSTLASHFSNVGWVHHVNRIPRMHVFPQLTEVSPPSKNVLDYLCYRTGFKIDDKGEMANVEESDPIPLANNPSRNEWKRLIEWMGVPVENRTDSPYSNLKREAVARKDVAAWYSLVRNSEAACSGGRAIASRVNIANEFWTLGSVYENRLWKLRASSLWFHAFDGNNADIDELSVALSEFAIYAHATVGIADNGCLVAVRVLEMAEELFISSSDGIYPLSATDLCRCAYHASANGEHATAELALNRANEVSADWAEAHGFRGWISIMSHNGKEAVRSFQKAIELQNEYKKNDSEWKVGLAMGYWQEGERDLAVRTYLEVAKVDKDWAPSSVLEYRLWYDAEKNVLLEVLHETERQVPELFRDSK